MAAFQENQYTVYGYQTGNTPIYFIRTVKYGCNYHKTIREVIKDGIPYLIYLSNIGEIRMTNLLTYDKCVSDKIRPVTLGILNSRTVKDYYTGTTANCIPHAFIDKKNGIYRLYYAGTSSNTNKCLNYFYNQDIFTTSSVTPHNDSWGLDSFSSNLAILGNSGGTGKAYVMTPSLSSTDKTGSLDLGWISTSSGTKKIKVNNMTIWYHAQSTCSCTLTASVYNDPSSATAVKTEARTLSYNSIANNIQKLRFSLGVIGDYVRISLADSGSSRDYSIDKIILSFEEIDSPNN